MAPDSSHVDAAKASASGRVLGPDAGQQREKPDWLLEIVGEGVSLVSIREPPFTLALDMPLGSRCEQDPPHGRPSTQTRQNGSRVDEPARSNVRVGQR